jgi:hypothetical protein
MDSANLIALAERVERAELGPHKLKFGAWPSGGQVVTTSPAIVALLCAFWNCRHEVAASLRARAALEAVHD